MIDFEGLVIMYPYISLFLISLVVTLVSTLSMKFFTNQERVKELKKEQKELQKKIKECQKNKDFCAIEKLNKEAVDLSMQLMKSSFSFKQFLITMLPLIFLFRWLREVYLITSLGKGWIWWYIGFSMVCSTIYRKLFKMA